ncbi:hypothetical protein XI03_19805 [Bradyrhizobium sp. CCBAU 65884]|nr:hypothetical protein [Bradyrhizobium sp. CCBAU 65884]
MGPAITVPSLEALRLRRPTIDRLASASHQCDYHIPVFKPAEDAIEPWLNLGKSVNAPCALTINRQKRMALDMLYAE